MHDFILFGSDLLWVQQKLFILSDDFTILECHHMEHPGGNYEDLVVLGIQVISGNIRGLLFNHYSFTSPVPSVIITKLTKMKSYASETHQPDY